MLFSEIIGQLDVKGQLIRTVSEQRIPHAQLFRGSKGIGKLALAIAYAQYICCENRKETDSCGVCPSCVKYNKLAHPDLHFVFPIIKPTNKTSAVCDDFIAEFRATILKNVYVDLNEWFAEISGDAKQGMIYANESEEILRKLSLKTYESEHKVMIIWLPEKMNETCSNRLLKILEEPPEKTIFLLVSNEPEQIITTILSRTQHIFIPKLSVEDIANKLANDDELEISKTETENIARIANGNYLTALSVLKEGNENKINFERFVLIMRLAWQVGNKKDHASLITMRKWADDMASTALGRERQKFFLNYAQHLTRENFILNLQEKNLNYLTAYESDFSSRFSPFINERNVEDLMNEFAQAEKHIERNVNAKMVFFDLSLKLIMLLKR